MSLLLALAAWHLDTLARRRANLNLCSKCGYDRTGILKEAKCPECGTCPASPEAEPELLYPFFVLIADEQCFVQCNTQRNLNFFEQPDIEEMSHWAWDTKGRKYKLVWRAEFGTWPQLVAEEDLAGFRAAVEEYRRKLAASGLRPTGKRYCDPDTMLAGGLCAKCGYDRTGILQDAKCPECGAVRAGA